MINHGLAFQYEDINKEDFYTRNDSQISVLCGTNNCGKTLILKQLFDRFGEEAYLCGTNRYYSFEHFSLYQETPEHNSRIWESTRTQIGDAKANYDPIVMNFSDVFIRMTDDERRDVYRICTECLGETVELVFRDPGNSMSNSFLTIGNTPLVQCSSGSRMLVHLVSVLVSKRFKVVLIDEPELGLTPRIQNAIQQLLFDIKTPSFPHLRHIYIATHSHIFLNRRCLSDNFLVQRDRQTVVIRRLSTYQQFRDLQFAQLGNSLEQLQLPSGFMIVEGKTDYAYMKRLLCLKFPNTRVNIIIANGDGEVKKKLHDLLEVIGKLDTSPYSNRVLVILDKTHSPTLKSDLGKVGLHERNIIEWSKNGIEYFYPESVLKSIFEDDALNVESLNMEADRIVHNGITKTKAELSEAVLGRMNGTEELDAELEQALSRVESFGDREVPAVLR